MTTDRAVVEQVVNDLFEGSINRHEWSAVERTIASDVYVDHDGPSGVGGVSEARVRYEQMFERFPDFHVDLKDLIINGDMAVVRGIWSGTDQSSGNRMGFKAFVQMRLEEGRIVERWAVATDIMAMEDGQGW